ncbi:GNAT family N-acetyltransferase [Paenisporosarcina sp. OV554]|uniref:GNAT family N-acetyltransferase n=1 Tax=Paenisporosarcina sp. OV554 TaxID=2135694 RepID=UPI000D3655F6|nr:GNAT family N-acetyltransferase [Paenisporosarcina sp. OV554]PUB10469.1 acetyltransferase (GNAT) family protein [Paenisporosarcina sp. OV554]
MIKNLKIKKVLECEIDNELTENIQELLTVSFQDIYPNNRIYFKQVPHFRFLAFNEEKHLLAQVGLDYRVMNLSGKLIKVLGIIDLCVSRESRTKGIASLLLSEIDKYCVKKDIDFLLLFADNKTLYLKNGYKSVKNKCKWLKIEDRNQTILGIGYEEKSELMIKKIGMNEWTEGDLDFLGYLY